MPRPPVARIVKRPELGGTKGTVELVTGRHAQGTMIKRLPYGTPGELADAVSILRALAHTMKREVVDDPG